MVMQVCVGYINTVLSLSRVSIQILYYPWLDDMITFKLQETTYVRNRLQAVPFWFGKSLHSTHFPKTELLWYLTCCRRTQLWAYIVRYLTIHQGNDKCCVFFLYISCRISSRLLVHVFAIGSEPTNLFQPSSVILLSTQISVNGLIYGSHLAGIIGPGGLMSTWKIALHRYLANKGDSQTLFTNTRGYFFND